MTDDELERRLRSHYRAIDPGVAPRGLGVRIDDALERRRSRSAFIARMRPAFATGLAAVVIVAVGLGLGLQPGGFLAAPGASPALSPSAQPSTASPEHSSPSSGATATVDLAGTFVGGGLWAIQGSTLFVSTDAGATWQGRNAPPPAGGSLVTAFVLDSQHAWTVTPGPGSTGSTGSQTDVLRLVVSRSADGGQSWQETALPGNYANKTPVLAFADAQHGYLLAAATRFSDGMSTILRTDDGGATWSIAGTSPWLGSRFSVSDASTLWAGAEQEAGPISHPILDVTRDGGRTWEDARLPGLEGQSGGAQLWLAGPPVFLDASTGFVAVNSSGANADQDQETRIFRTTDGGRSWILAADRPVEASAGPAVLDAAHWLLPTDNPSGLFATADGGTSWTPLTMSGLSSDSVLFWIGAADAGHAAALVPTGTSYPGPATLYLGADGGTTWRPAAFGGASAPVPSPSASPSPGPSPSPTPIVALPSGSVPPVSTAAWSGLRLQAIEGGPVNALSVVDWSGGYLALGPTSNQDALPAWFSRDGRSWVTLPTDTFGAAIIAQAAPCADGVLVAVQSRTGQTTVWRSIDGVSWTSNPAPQLRFGPFPGLAGGPGGAVAILEGYPYRIAFSADCVTWQTVSLPGDPAFSVQRVAALRSGFVAVGDAGAARGSVIAASPVAWWSADGLHWTLVHVQAHPGGFFDAQAATNGLVAFSTSGGTPGVNSFWTSASGQSWTLSKADPLGVFQPGDAGVGFDGEPTGAFLGDGTRLLGHGNHGTDPTQYWVSFDATRWTRLALAGDTAAAAAGQVMPFLLRDGVLFSGDQGAWFGAAVK